jgi:hypothetical protein
MFCADFEKQTNFSYRVGTYINMYTKMDYTILRRKQKKNFSYLREVPADNQIWRKQFQEHSKLGST